MDGGTARYNIMSTIDDVEDTDDENDDDFVPDDESDDENEPLGDFEADEIAPGSKKKSKKQKSGKKSAKRKAGGGLAALGGGGPTSVKAVAKPKTKRVGAAVESDAEDDPEKLMARADAEEAAAAQAAAAANGSVDTATSNDPIDPRQLKRAKTEAAIEAALSAPDSSAPTPVATASGSGGGAAALTADDDSTLIISKPKASAAAAKKKMRVLSSWDDDEPTPPPPPPKPDPLDTASDSKADPPKSDDTKTTNDAMNTTAPTATATAGTESAASAAAASASVGAAATKPAAAAAAGQTIAVNFAGEKILIAKPAEKGGRRVASSSRLDAALSALNTRNLTTIEKSRVDWKKNKDEVGDEHALKQFTKDGYLDKQNFLAATEQRQLQVRQALTATRQKPAYLAARES